MREKAKVRQIQEDEDVQKALAQTAPGEEKTTLAGRAAGRASLGLTGGVFLLLGALYAAVAEGVENPGVGKLDDPPARMVARTEVYNYSWPLFPYIWNEIRIPIAYESDLDFVAETMLEVAEKQVGREMEERVRIFRDLLAKTPVDQLTVQEKPVVLFRSNENTWLEAIVRHVVDPKRAGRVKTALLRELLAKLRAAPDRVLIPKGNSR